MATILLSTAGAALGSSVGGSVLGLSMTAIGRFAGAMIGNAIDRRGMNRTSVATPQQITGGGSETIETGQMNRFRMTAAGEGRPIGQVFGRMRVAGQVIWSSEFEERIYTF